MAIPHDADDLSALAVWANRTRTPLIPRGSGSGMAGGAVGSGVIVDLSRLNEIGVVDKTARRVLVATGAIRGEINKLARERGLRFPVDPSSGDFCTIGGMVATNAAGARTLRYGATRRWVTALDCVFADG
ncbi:MAG: FAD-binding oxidoreductase, partial [Anaerolineae bacterium]|nr:FAD-binding oxidoreductase [Gemmatimonadaceae bacterium]